MKRLLKVSVLAVSLLAATASSALAAPQAHIVLEVSKMPPCVLELVASLVHR